MYSVGSEREAKELLTLACPMNYQGEFIATHLVEEQTLERLEEFSAWLDKAHDRLAEGRGCDCA